ncbi:penicillin-binding protein [Actinoplanes sp. SE50]|uniref:penicillin-binding transpeptidase domain-containing protein n=1 Tax=unclassified Actinoplanes TaxID=2626549 RepID=UPI00023EDF5B|nr:MULTISPECIES: penicillin-binding transpeptidase domain-containing protein [unclassified Actinoplanes]AEV88291.1 Penicillin-binding protein 3 [Actinoplanes sp. SE50/110]ATO86696.1 penicillin-binding protein [Actinoplanes sp. SE50]SLM04114.1 penicillin-binding protein [Actinoplanes sp. SE50/110]
MRRATVGLTALFTLATAGLAGCSGDKPQDTVVDFVNGWKNGDLGKVGFVTAGGGKIASADVLAAIKSTYGDLKDQPLAVSVAGDPTESGDVATTPIDLKWTLPGNVIWEYRSSVRMTRRSGDGWQVIWEPAVLQPQLDQGEKFRLHRVPAQRGTVLDAAGKPLVGPQKVVVIGVSPEKITNLPALTKALTAAFKKIKVDVDLAGLKDRVAKADPGAFLDLVTLRRPDYDTIRDQVRPLPGTVFREETRQLAPTRVFARALLGTVDPATKDDLDNRPSELTAGDQVGHGGLQGRYDQQLRGTPGLSVVASAEAADASVQEKPIFTAPPVNGKDIRVSLDTATQNAADRAIGAQKLPSSMVALRISDGSVLAVANGPDAGGVDTALTGQVPPGSTFKMISAYGLLSTGKVTADTVVECPRTRVVDGQTFKNSHDEALGKVPFHVDFAKSCNTAFVGLSSQLGADGLKQAAAALGLGGGWTIGVDAFTGKVSDGASPTELAAATFGQGTTAVSPIAMAVATAAVAKGGFQAPKLVLDPAPPAAPAPAALNPAALPALRSMMREVVTGGTGTALKAVPGKPVYGKTGTAEFATGSDETHSWFIGYQDDIAFAVMVQKGGAGAEAAVPIVNQFLTTLTK